ncbi:MAG: hypothetical protein ACRD1R_02885 [Acidobacteriota bacterium]
MKDSSPEVERIYREMMMKKTASERLRMACDMFETAKEIATAQLAGDKPEDLRERLFERFYGSEFTSEERSRIRARIRARRTT